MILDGTYPKSPISMISDKKSIENEVVFNKTLPWTESEGCSGLFPVPLQNCSERLRTSLDVFGSLRKTLDMFVLSLEILTSILRLKISRL